MRRRSRALVTLLCAAWLAGCTDNPVSAPRPPAGPQLVVNPDAGVTVLGTLPGARYMLALDVTDNGLIIGSAGTDTGSVPVVFGVDGTPVPLPLPAGAALIDMVAANNGGVILGYASMNGATVGLRWEHGAVEVLRGPDGADFLPVGINAVGDIAGNLGADRVAARRAPDGTFTLLPVPGGGSWCSAAKMNEAGVIVGSCLGIGGIVVWPVAGDPVVWDAPSGTLGCGPWGINDAGEVASLCSTATEYRLVRWSAVGVPQVLDAGLGLVLFDMAANGDVIGFVRNPSTATVWSGASERTALPAPSGALGTVATAVNRLGDVVGYAGDPGGAGRALVWRRAILGLPADNNGTPVAVISAPRTVIVGGTVQFSGAGSSDPDGDPLTHHWAFGTGATANGPTVTYTYPQVGTYTITLTVNDGRGGTAVATHEISVVGATLGVAATFADDLVATGTPTRLDLRITTPGLAIGAVTGSIDWGDGASTPLVKFTTPDGTTDLVAFANKHYATAGPKLVVVRVQDAAGQTGQIAVTTNVVRTVQFDAPDEPCVTRKKGKEADLCRRTKYGGVSYPVVILSAPGFDPSTVVLSSLRLGDGLGPDVPPVLCTTSKDVNGDKVKELACAFDTEQVRLAVTTLGPQTLVLQGRYGPGGSLFLRGTDAVRGL